MSDLEHVRRAIDKLPRPRTPLQPEFFMPAMPPLGLITALENRWYAWRRRRLVRRYLLPLLAYDDRILEDMGHHRDDIEWALRLPLHEDALAALEQRRCQRNGASIRECGGQ
ncbi:hypothetical protein MHM84_05950 [Halomonas sp. McH1-25]|uniref:hypothetical protein n=1 Tax=unclassified Halomonas TaxID=2609666 RepID=UPI001EF57022|nr:MULTISPECIES: hypothetical protein [unclassified Halomonas]MCG7599321.1 hypothetical protein [Halomonas sp. McH1-25]MCP1341189.1 hypothetical protein [Halomonas sp. FL8]MCP1362095.1 hypothetical protein [Halomonas sp. BBD45]MCP1366310.1 hypothetical protein [Halomonas sp. BBD48]